MTAYYNEIDPKAAAWLRELIAHGHIAPGDVDERSISDVKPEDLKSYTQCHFFAGIGVWSHALRRAGWPDDRPLWTGSCPCQPFSVAGRRGGTADERHLWPHWHWLIAQCRPSEVFGEQVASKDGRAWLDTVSADMEALGFAIGAADMCAAGVGAPHIRQRLWFYAERMADTAGTGPQVRAGKEGVQEGVERPERFCTTGRMADTDDAGPQGRAGMPERADQRAAGAGSVVGPANPTNGFWGNPDWLLCRDGKWRCAQPGTFPLAHGSPARVGRLRGYGNAIVAPVAQSFIEATQDW